MERGQVGSRARIRVSVAGLRLQLPCGNRIHFRCTPQTRSYVDMRSYDLVRRPLQSLSADAIKRAAPECRYIVVDNEGRTVLAGQAPVVEDAGFHIDLGNALPAGRFTLMAELVVNGNAMNAEIRHFPIEVSSRP